MLLLVALPAFALDWYLESPDRADRSEPSAVEEVAVAQGFDARVVRRFSEGEGWRYVARIDGFADSSSAKIAARQLADATGVSLVVVEVDGDKASTLAEVSPSAKAPRVAPQPEEEDASGELKAMLAAHESGRAGVLSALHAKLLSGPVRFEYRRTLSDGKVAQHRWALREEQVYVEVWGDVTARKLRVSRNRAELSVGGGAFSSQGLESSQAVVESLSPLKIIPVVLTLGSAIENRREFQAMVVAGTGERAGVDTVLLRFGGDATTGSIELEVGAGDHLLRRVSFDEGARVYELSDFREVAGAKLPFAVTELRNDLVVDRVQIDRLEVGGTLPSEWFTEGR